MPTKFDLEAWQAQLELVHIFSALTYLLSLNILEVEFQ